MSNVPPFGDKQRQVGPPPSGGGSGPDPAIFQPPEVRESSELGAVLRYALEDHTHQSPVIYWPQIFGPGSMIVSNRVGYITVSTFSAGGTNLCSYEAASVAQGLNGNFSTISGGYENSALGGGDFIGGGSYNSAIRSALVESSNVICGGYSNTISEFGESVIVGGLFNEISNPDPLYVGSSSVVLGGYFNQVNCSGSCAMGILARSYNPGQFSHSSGGISFGGFEQSAAQYSRIVTAGDTNGAVADESIVLIPWVELGNVVSLQADRGYLVILEVVDVNAATGDMHTWVISSTCYVDSLGVITVKNQSTVSEYSDASSSLHSVSVGSVGGVLEITFSTGAGNVHRCNVCCTLRMTEVISTGV